MWIISILIVGALAGFLAGKLLKGSGFGLFGNIVIGILGSAVGSFLFGVLNISMGSGLIGRVVTSIIGALVFLFVYGKIIGKRKEA